MKMLLILCILHVMLMAGAKEDRKIEIYSNEENIHEQDSAINHANSIHGDRIHESGTNRSSKDSSPKVIEVAVFVDNELDDYIKANASGEGDTTTKRVLAYMNQAQSLFNHSSMLTRFKFVVVKIKIMKPGDLSNQESLKTFCKWSSAQNPPEGEHGHWDHAIWLVSWDPYERNDSRLGEANIGSMCWDTESCSWSNGQTFLASYTIVHEVGHALGADHDGEGNKCDKRGYMAPSMDTETGYWTNCTNNYIKELLQRGDLTCLNNDVTAPSKDLDLNSLPLPGVQYPLSEQCVVHFGSNYSLSTKEQSDDVCKMIYCEKGNGSKSEPAHPALEGSICGDGKICIQRECVSSSSAGYSTVGRTTNLLDGS